MRLIQQVPETPPKAVICGEAPGKEENETGKPFIGDTGQILRMWFRRMGLRWHDFFVTNTVHVQPPGNKYYLLKPEELEAGKRQLISDLTRLKASGLNLVVAVGDKALTLLTGRSGISKYRGAILPCTLVPGLKVLPIYHPSYINRGKFQYEPLYIPDLTKMKKEMLYPEIVYPQRDITVVTSEADAIKRLHELTNTDIVCSCDIESIGPVMVAYGIATSKTEAFSIIRELLRRPPVLRQLSKFCISSTPKIFHNALFDCLHNAYYYSIVNKNIFYDTMLAQHAAYPTLFKSLAFCASIYTNEPYWKDLKEGEDVKDYLKEYKTGTISWDSLYIYNGKDCCLTYEIYEMLEKEIDDWGSRPAFNLMMSMVEPCLFAMVRGTKLDQLAVEAFKKDNEKAITVLEGMKEHVIGEVNVKSFPQMKKLLYSDWGLPRQRNKGKVACDDNALKKLERLPVVQKPLIGLVRSLKKHYKKRDFYTLKTDEDGRIRTALKIHGTYTGRFASSKSITGSGKNLLNIPKETRSFYKCDPRTIFLQSDLSQSEARIVASLCGDEEWLRHFDITDIHTETAAFLFGIKESEVKKNYHRYIAKRIAHGTHYGLGKNLMASILGSSVKEAKELQDRYHKMHPSLRQWQNRVKKQVKQTRVIKTIFGRTIQFFGRLTDKTYRDAVAAEPQSTSADYLSTGLRRVYNAGIPSWEFRLSVYDSILCQVSDDIDVIAETIKIMKKCVEVPIIINGLTFVIPLDFEIGYSWGDMKEVETLDDLERVYREVNR